MLLQETLHELRLRPGDSLLDMTFGAGGHSIAALKSTPDLKLIALDRDPVAYQYARDLCESFPGQVTPLLGKFSDLPRLLQEQSINAQIDAVLFDLGCSSMQFDTSERGFSVSKNGPLDMRMNQNEANLITAADIIAHASESDLWRILKYYGGEKHCKLIARAIVESRFAIQPVRTTQQLAKLVEMVCGFSYRKDKLQRRSHVATKVFQALRIFVNNEINELNYGMILAHKMLKPGGRLVAISFHSLEDRVVKRHLQDNVIDNAVSPLPLKYTNVSLAFGDEEMQEFRQGRWKAVCKHMVKSDDEEVFNNPRSRSAKLRAAYKVY